MEVCNFHQTGSDMLKHFSQIRIIDNTDHSFISFWHMLEKKKQQVRAKRPLADALVRLIDNHHCQHHRRDLDLDPHSDPDLDPDLDFNPDLDPDRVPDPDLDPFHQTYPCCHHSIITSAPK